jgi:hypothetical protein
MASSPVATAAQAVEQDAAALPVAQTAGGGSKNAQSTTVQDTVTLSNGIPQQTPAEEAGLFQVNALTLNSAPARDSLNSANPNIGNLAVPNAGATNFAGGAGPLQAGAETPPAVRPQPRVPPAAVGDAPVANAGATAPAAAPANTSAQAPVATTATPAAFVAGAQSAGTPTSQSQALLDQFTQYLQQLGLSPQAMNQILQAAEILNSLDPPAMQQAIVELRAQAATLAAQASGVPLPTAPTVRAGVSPTASAAPTQQGTAGVASAATSK